MALTSVPPPDDGRSPDAAGFRQLEALFAAALAQPAGRREAWLAAQDVPGALREELRALLAADLAAEARIARVMTAAAQAATASPRAEAVERGAMPADEAGQPSLPGWQLLRRLGVGGMGTVYLARAVRAAPDGTPDASPQLAPNAPSGAEDLPSVVAIKLLRGDVDPTLLIDRFEAERRILSTLSHPGIARLLGAGRSADGRPFLVLEYVEGEPIDRWCAGRTLDLRARAALLAQVCDAVRNAHRNLVVHRDLKPGNVLVGADGAPKLLDFGIAKLLEGPASGVQGTVTRLGWMTPDYASPEQVSGEPVRPASDVYSLGVLAYRVFAGVSPYGVDGDNPSALARAIVETEVPLASQRAQAAGAPPQQVRALRGDLDRILAKALDKAPDRRYGDAGELCEDLRRWLQGLPVSARPTTLRYRAGKFLRRHRAASALAALLALSLGVYLLSALRLLQEARAERDRASQTAALLGDLFEIAEPHPARGNTITARALLDRGRDRAALRLRGQPQAHIDFLTTLSRLYRRLGIYDRAADCLRQALALQRGLGAADSLDAADLTLQLARTHAAAGEFETAEPLFRRALALRRTHLPAHDPRIGESLRNLALVQHDLGRYAEAQRLYAEVAAGGEGFDPDAVNLGNQALLYYDLGDYARSERAYRQVLALRTARNGEAHESLAYVHDELGMALLAQGRLDEASVALGRGLEIRRRTLGEDHRDLARSLDHLGSLALARRDPAAAEALHRQALALRLRTLGAEHPETAESRLGLGLSLLAQAQASALARTPADAALLGQAGRELTSALRLYEAATGPDHPLRGRPRDALARWAQLAGDCGQARAHAQRALALLPQADPRRAGLRGLLVACGAGAADAGDRVPTQGVPGTG